MAKSSKKIAAAQPAPAKKPEPKKAGNTVTLKGKGNVPVYGDGAMRRIPCGRPVKVSDAERAFLKRSRLI